MRGGGLDVRVARDGEDLAAHHRVRRAVFVEEQAVFEGDDRDAWDDHAVKVVAELDGEVVGAVRLYPLDEAGLWKGDRLAVLPAARPRRVGAPLVRFAVRTAGELGGSRMIALIQRRNVPFFQHLGWTTIGGAADFRGRSHQEMTIALAGAAPGFAPAGYRWALGGA
ncbi:MSMEG_0567/Sll0786 family nitrogen starvation N-acetyltransferase [Miltoncostaea marina]|uniref:MSMEG_0567/Sll0786 family nitrogen starvation N-acetyltransferase n=1 Tax=Miltoncostaea marina TaxID=2843215 RepID=UPI001C3D92BD|nr:MSMEG_0567/Sll0786 family nitrogen starvation N-acetyltransferase [Miltoncostaea marina]